MTAIQNDYVEKVYAGVLGMVIGVRHGANIEQWSHERIKKAFGEITGYLHDFKNFAADDDLNGPMFFIRALEDYTYTSDISPKEMGLTWLNYAPDGHGFFWWGGYGTSTENTAYENLSNGIMAPYSGSAKKNGQRVAEQIGGQIFVDVWGLINPGNPKKAAEYAEKAASVSHDLNGKYGGMFVAACIAEAFRGKPIQEIIKIGLSHIPQDCDYSNLVKDIVRYHEEYPDNWESCFNYIYNNYGYDRYPGICHIIPNTAIIILSLLYGKGDFSKTINICNMCGWDTDSTLGNLGTIMGVYSGLDGIDMYWREPINDFLCCSSVIGSLNILDIPWCAMYISDFGYKLAGEDPPDKWSEILNENSTCYHFELPGSTHAFRTNTNHKGVQGFVENTTEFSFNGNRSLKVMFDYCNGGYSYRTYVKTYYSPDDFEDNRYEPSFSPKIYPGQKLECNVMIPKEGIDDVKVNLYIVDRNRNKFYYGKDAYLTPGEWKHLTFSVPYMKNVCIQDAGVEFVPIQEERRRNIMYPSLIGYLDNFKITGNPNYELEFKSERIENWSEKQKEVSQLTYLRGLWELDKGDLVGTYHGGKPGEAYTGSIDWENYNFEVDVIPTQGKFHNINFRVQGGIRSYALGLSEDNRISLYKNDNGYQELASRDFNWKLGNIYRISVEAIHNRFKISIDGNNVLEYIDKENPYLKGQVGFSNFGGSRTHYRRFAVKGL